MNRILQTALSYYDNNDELIYSYHGNTFLQGGELYDSENGGRGRIDCSTLVHLALQGINYEYSPYVTGEPESFFGSVCLWQNPSAGRMSEVFAARSARADDIRRAYGLARYCREMGLEIADGDVRRPGDLVFFEAPASVREEYIRYGAYMAVSHVGIVAEDTDMMINATGRSDHEYNVQHEPVRIMAVMKKGQPLITARIAIR